MFLKNCKWVVLGSIFLGSSLNASFEIFQDLESPFFRERNGTPIQYLLLHYTAGDGSRAVSYFNGSLGVEVSTHYLTNTQGKIYSVVPLDKSAYHAGRSYWGGVQNLNDSSIGIENVNFGYKREGLEERYPESAPFVPWELSCDREWEPFPETQVDSIISLCQSIVEEYNILPRNVIGHSDIAPDRKQDPGPLFPWYTLYQAGIGAWPDESLDFQKLRETPELSVPWVQSYLKIYGYNAPENGMLDPETQSVIEAFQMHFDPSTSSFGKIDEHLTRKLGYLVDQHVL